MLEMLLVLGAHFLLMGMVVLLVNMIVSYFVSHPYIWIFVVVSMIAGYVYFSPYGTFILSVFAIIFNGIISLLGIGLVKLGLYAKHKAEKEA
ncbi:hypothetical protein [Gracilibacillus sp. YIM 98692]|uniref:hypothetical protein n=1 Tax=Gracilibacillus sp. YIM 98692 TaxID=2663532 RepID=UPI0013D33435|nr:hypothetical protein [Gracilibacillus sp. YIM 98692]